MISGERLAEVLEGLERARGCGSPEAIERLLALAGDAEPEDPATLIRLHEALLFHRAHPRSKGAVALAERALARISARVARLQRDGFEMEAFDAYEAAGVAGTTVSMTFTHPVARRLAERAPRSVSIDWEVHDAPEGLERVLPRLIPLVAEEALADVGVDYRAWLDAARPRGVRELPWLLSRLDALDESDATKALLYDALKLQVSWTPAPRESRTLARWPARPFFLEESFARRSSVSLAEEMRHVPRLRRLSAAEGKRALDLCISAVLVRYRELHAFTHGDPGAVWHADLGRGAAALICGIAKGHRLPLRAGFGFLLLRNGVPVGYGDAYALGEKLDLAFNVFYTFRDGESAFLYARLAAAFRALLGVNVLRADPYQIGKENEEAVASGAFFFYRKLGFVSADPRLEALARREAKKRAADPERRTSRAALRRLSEAPVLWAEEPERSRAWARFSVRALAARAMKGDAEAKRVVAKLERAKRGRDEVAYARELAADAAFRAAVLRLGSS